MVRGRMGIGHSRHQAFMRGIPRVTPAPACYAREAMLLRRDALGWANTFTRAPAPFSSSRYRIVVPPDGGPSPPIPMTLWQFG